MAEGKVISPADLAELRARLSAIGDEFAQRDAAGEEPVALLVALHRRRAKDDPISSEDAAD